MKDREETETRAQAFRIGCKAESRFRTGTEENALDPLFVLKSEPGPHFRHVQAVLAEVHLPKPPSPD